MGWGEREGGRKKGGIMFQHELLFPESKLDRIIESKLNRMSILRFRFFFFFFFFVSITWKIGGQYGAC